MKKTTAKPLPGLSPTAAAWRQLMVDSYSIHDPGGLTLLQCAAEALDRVAQAADLIERHGLLISDRFGSLKLNPAISVERDARAAVLTALRQLHLDIVPVRDGPGRPPGVY